MPFCTLDEATDPTFEVELVPAIFYVCSEKYHCTYSTLKFIQNNSKQLKMYEITKNQCLKSSKKRKKNNEI